MGFTASSVLILDNTDTNIQFTPNAGTPFSVPIPAGSTGIWKYVVAREGYSANYGTFDVTGGGLDAASIVQSLLRQPSGAPLYGGSDSSLISIVFAEDRCNIDIGDGTVTPQQIIDEIEDALITEDGCRFLALTEGSQSSFATLGGQSYLLLGTKYRLRRANAGDVNATVEGFAISADGQPIDGVNGSVAYLSSVTVQPQTIRDAMALALTPGTTVADESLDDRMVKAPAKVWEHDISGATTDGQAGKELLDAQDGLDESELHAALDNYTNKADYRADVSNLSANVNVVEVAGVAVTSIDQFKADISNLSTHSAADVWAVASRTLSAAAGVTAQNIIDIATAVEDRIINDGDGTAVVNAIVNAIGNSNVDELSLVASIRADLERTGGAIEGIQTTLDNAGGSGTEALTAGDIVNVTAAVRADMERGSGMLDSIPKTDHGPAIAANSTSLTTILADTNELQQNQADWATATGFSTHSAADIWAATTRTLTAATDMSPAQIAAIATATEAALLNEGDSQQLIDAIVQGIGNANLDEVTFIAALRADLERSGGGIDNAAKKAGVAAALSA